MIFAQVLLGYTKAQITSISICLEIAHPSQYIDFEGHKKNSHIAKRITINSNH